jgi:hypothetical protein
MKNIKKQNVLVLVLAAIAAVAQAQGVNNDTGTPMPNMPAVATPSSTNPTAPVEGKNSFTKAQANSRLSKAGFSRISGLVQGDDGIWHATARKRKMTYKVSLDYQGNITSKK